MTWIMLSILAGLSDACSWVFMKKVKGLDNIIGAWVKFVFALPLITCVMIFFDFETISLKLFIIVLLDSLGIFAANYFIFKAAQTSDISKSMPLISFTPLMLLVTSQIMVNEFPDFSGFVGIIFIVFGAYYLNVGTAKENLFKPIKLLFKNRGSRYILIAAAIFSLTSNLTKIGVKMSNPGFFTLLNYIVMSILFIPLVVKRIEAKSFKNNLKYFFIIGGATGVMMISVTIALNVGLVPYVISLKRTNALFSVFFGYLFFKEGDIKNSIAGAFFMFIGVLLIGIF